jgi:hypothetical protein
MYILKYVIGGNQIPIIFSKEITHSEVLQDVISAGFLFVKFDTAEKKFIVKCFGESSSLKLKPANEDKNIIENYLNTKLLFSKI